MIIYFKKYGDAVTVYRERRPTRDELKKNPDVLVVEEAVTVRFQTRGRDPEVKTTRKEKT